MKTILAATDLSARSDRAVLRAAHLARDTGAALQIIHVIDEDLPGAMLLAQTTEVEATLSAMVAENPALADLSPSLDVEAGHLDSLLPKLMRERDIDLLVVGSHRRRGLADVFGAPTLSRLLRSVDVPVLVAVGRPEGTYEAVTIGWDFSPAGEAAAKAVQDFAPSAAMTLIHAWQDPVAGTPYGFETGGTIPPEALDRLRSKLQRAAMEMVQDGTPPATDVIIGPAGHVLRRYAAEHGADLLAMGRHARTGLARILLGSPAEDVALNAPCDVLIAPPL